MRDERPCVLLISPGIIKWTDMDFGLPHLVSIGGYLEQQLPVRVEILDLNYEGGDQRHLQRTLEELGPYALIGLSCYSSFDYMRVMTLARFLKTLYPDVPLVTGGYHASALPDDVIFEDSPFDAVIPGEGELTMVQLVETVLGGGRIEKKVYPKAIVEDLDSLPPYRWDLLNRYWPRAHDIGRKFQIYLSRGCVYHCTFCMERAKSGYRWRSYSAERAIDELKRLSTYTDLERWVVNLADPLFGFKRSWRREVLEGIIAHDLLPRQYWTLTRSDDLHEEDIALLARANFSIGIGMESGSPRMLKIMQKGNKPEAYLEAQLRLARLSRKHGLNWAGNIIVGHPGETLETMAETRDFAYELFTSASETCGWLSIDPFRLYPGSHVHEHLDLYASAYGTHFYHKEWWKSWYDAPFRAEHLDASHEVDFATRVDVMYRTYGPLIEEIIRRFRGQGRSVDRVFERSLHEQAAMMSPAMRDQLLRHAERARQELATQPSSTPSLALPIGLHVKDESVRRREEAVRRLLERGILRTERLIEAFLHVAPERHLDAADATAMLRDQRPQLAAEGDPVRWLGISTLAIAFEALNPGLSDRVADLGATRSYVAALMSELVGPAGQVVVQTPLGRLRSRHLSRKLPDNARLVHGTLTTAEGLSGPFDGVYAAGAFARRPAHLLELLREPEGRLVTSVGPRFFAQDIVCLTRRDDDWNERIVARAEVPVLAGPYGWLKRARAFAQAAE